MLKNWFYSDNNKSSSDQCDIISVNSDKINYEQSSDTEQNNYLASNDNLISDIKLTLNAKPMKGLNKEQSSKAAHNNSTGSLNRLTLNNIVQANYVNNLSKINKVNSSKLANNSLDSKSLSSLSENETLLTDIQRPQLNIKLPTKLETISQVKWPSPEMPNINNQDGSTLVSFPEYRQCIRNSPPSSPLHITSLPKWDIENQVLTTRPYITDTTLRYRHSIYTQSQSQSDIPYISIDAYNNKKHIFGDCVSDTNDCFQETTDCLLDVINKLGNLCHELLNKVSNKLSYYGHKISNHLDSL